jgi:hypothetical protein
LDLILELILDKLLKYFTSLVVYKQVYVGI